VHSAVRITSLEKLIMAKVVHVARSMQDFTVCHYCILFSLTISHIIRPHVTLYIDQKRPIVIKLSLQPSVGQYVCICLYVSLSVCLSSACKMTVQIWMQFRMVGWMGPEMRQVVELGDSSAGGNDLGGQT